MRRPNRTNRLCIVAGALCSTVLLAQTPAYFPLETGNSWLYRSKSNNGGESTFRSISVQGQETIQGRQYFNVDYFERKVVLRSDPDGTVAEFDRASGTERPWLQLRLPEDATFQSYVDPCSVATARLQSRTANVSVPAGTFGNVVQIGFQVNCADTGVTQQFYAPYVGLVQHEETSFAGPRQYELVYYHTASSSSAGAELSFAIGLDAPRYAVGSNMGVRLTLRSNSPDPITLNFPSGQSYDIKLFNESGEAVYVWSAARIFAMVIRQETFGPGERTYGVEIPLGNLQPGRYRAQGFLTTNPLMYLGEVSFEIVP